MGVPRCDRYGPALLLLLFLIALRVGHIVSDDAYVVYARDLLQPRAVVEVHDPDSHYHLLAGLHAKLEGVALPCLAERLVELLEVPWADRFRVACVHQQGAPFAALLAASIKSYFERVAGV